LLDEYSEFRPFLKLVLQVKSSPLAQLNFDEIDAVFVACWWLNNYALNTR
jgi:hypothetical protein